MIRDRLVVWRERRTKGTFKAAVKSFRDLLAWQRSIELATAVYRLTESFPREEMYGVRSQIKRSAVSLPSNIAEGQGRLTTGEFRQFSGVARGSNFELRTQMEVARTLKPGNAQHLHEVESLPGEVGKIINAILARTTR